jgi:hypothetical protein
LPTIQAQEAGGRASAIIQIANAKEKKRLYDLNPNFCLNCETPIYSSEQLKLRETLTRKFCSKSCAGTYNNVVRSSRREITNVDRASRNYDTCPLCSASKRREAKVCRDCKNNAWKLRTKGELFSSRTNWQCARSTIQKRARVVYLQTNRIPACAWCGYTHHVEICHIRPVCEFSDETPLGVINDPSNLQGLCPTHHWEHDNLPSTQWFVNSPV